MTKITNEMLVEFLKDIVTKLETNSYDKDEFFRLISFYLQNQRTEVDEFDDEKLVEYAMMGWYISKNLKVKNS
jgi:hypothetical protein